MIQDQQLFILGEFYLKKANLPAARDIFQKLLESNPDSYQVAFNLGRIEHKLGRLPQAIENLEKARFLNPVHKATLQLLSKAYDKDQKIKKALECMVDVYLLSKETKDSRTESYKKKVRNLSKKVGPEMDDQQKNLLTKERLQFLNQQITNLEKMLNDPKKDRAESIPPAASAPTLIENSQVTIATIEEAISFADLNIDQPETVTEVKTESFSNPSTLDDSLMAEIDEHIAQETDTDFEGIEDPVHDEKDNVVSPDFSKSEKMHDIRRHIVFRTLSQSELDKIQKFSTVQSFEKNEVIHTPLEPIYGFSCVLEGKVRIYHQNESLMELEAGAIIDEAELCNGVKYFFETRAVESASILMVNKAALLTLCKLQHELAVHFLWHFYKSLSLKINSIFESIIYQNPSQKTIWNLDRLQEITQQRLLNELEIEYLSQRLTKRMLRKNDFIFKNHAPADTFYILLEGEVELQHPASKDTIDIKVGEYFSEIGLISNSFEHSMNAQVVSDQAILLHIDRAQLTRLHDPNNRDNYRMMEILWNIYSRKYFEFLNFHYHLLKS
jgi:CRP-like cAMP-binding protein